MLYTKTLASPNKKRHWSLDFNFWKGTLYGIIIIIAMSIVCHVVWVLNIEKKRDRLINIISETTESSDNRGREVDEKYLNAMIIYLSPIYYGPYQNFMVPQNNLPAQFKNLDYLIDNRNILIFILLAGLECSLILAIQEILAYCGYRKIRFFFLFLSILYVCFFSFISCYAVFFPAFCIMIISLALLFIIHKLQKYRDILTLLIFLSVGEAFSLPPHLMSAYNFYTISPALITFSNKVLFIANPLLVISILVFFYIVPLYGFFIRYRRIRSISNKFKHKTDNLCLEISDYSNYEYDYSSLDFILDKEWDKIAERGMYFNFNGASLNLETQTAPYLLWIDNNFIINSTRNQIWLFLRNLEYLLAKQPILLIRREYKSLTHHNFIGYRVWRLVETFLDRVGSFNPYYHNTVSDQGPFLLQETSSLNKDWQENPLPEIFFNPIASNKLDRFLIETPYPLSVLLLNILYRPIASSSFYQIMAMWECVLHTIGIMTISLFSKSKSQNSGFVKRWEKAKRSPSMGLWIELSNMALKECPYSTLSKALTAKVEIDSTTNYLRSVLGYDQDWGNRIKNMHQLLSLGVSIRNSTIGHGTLAYDYSDAFIIELSKLLSIIMHWFIKFKFCIGFVSNDGFISYTGFLPPKDLIYKNKAHIVLRIENEYFDTDLIQWDPCNFDFLFYNGHLFTRNEFKSYNSGYLMYE